MHRTPRVEREERRNRVTMKEYKSLKEDFQNGGMMAQKGPWTLMGRKKNKEELPETVRVEVQEHTAMMEEGKEREGKKEKQWKTT